jgi:hypothetical protein
MSCPRNTACLLSYNTLLSDIDGGRLIHPQTTDAELLPAYTSIMQDTGLATLFDEATKRDIETQLLSFVPPQLHDTFRIYHNCVSWHRRSLQAERPGSPEYVKYQLQQVRQSLDTLIPRF